MAEDPLDPELIRSIESLAEKFGFTLVDRVSKGAFTLRGSSILADQDHIERAFLPVITRFGLVAKFEWTESNYQRLTIFLFTPAEYETSHQNVRGTIGATIGGRPMIYPNPDHEEVYVTFESGKPDYIECDATELPDGIHLYFGFPVMVDRGRRVIVGPAQQE